MSDQIKVDNIKMHNRGALILECDVEIVDWNIIFREIKYFRKGDSCWVKMPGRSWKDSEDQWCNKDLVKFTDLEAKERFGNAVCEKINKVLEAGEESLPF